MDNITVNLARKWRSKNFDELIGQDLAVRLIKNSLYKNFIFPVYLFCGNKGCGKTSAARLFATALNCDELVNFQANPQLTQPCLKCKSCIASRKFQHPDIIEIDAASHTGVDNIRTIIENASFAPILGNKKIYIIDEAHMLSKAAFNALLKILEEPPASVVFMLATTDAPKILDTVRSRSFQLLFFPIAADLQVKQLELICKEENIPYDIDGLYSVAQESEGSMRDAINIMERVRLAFAIVSKKNVLDTIGYPDDELIKHIVSAILASSVDKVLELTANIKIERYNILLIWKKLTELIHKGLQNPNLFNCSQKKLLQIFEICCEHELILTKSSVPQYALQAMLIKLCGEQGLQAGFAAVSAVASPARPAPAARFVPDQIGRTEPSPLTGHAEGTLSHSVHVEGQSFSGHTEQFPLPGHTEALAQPKVEVRSIDNNWSIFISELEKTDDPMVTSIFKQGILKNINKEQNCLDIDFDSKLSFFKDLIDNSKAIWMPLIKKQFGNEIKINLLFEAQVKKNFSVNFPVARAANSINNASNIDLKTNSVSAGATRYLPEKKSNSQVNISDAKIWPKANMLVKIFPGTITTLEGNL